MNLKWKKERGKEKISKGSERVGGNTTYEVFFLDE